MWIYHASTSNPTRYLVEIIGSKYEYQILDDFSRHVDNTIDFRFNFLIVLLEVCFELLDSCDLS